MKDRLTPASAILFRFLLTFTLFVLIFQLQRFCFIAYYRSLLGETGLREIFAAAVHGAVLDMSVAGYFSVIPGFLSIAAVSLGFGNRFLRAADRIYFAFASVVISTVFVSDLALYEYWGFRLDFTPLFYLLSSPADAFASVSPWVALLGLILVAICSAVCCLIFFRVLGFADRPVRGLPGRLAMSFAMLFLTAALFLPIRGGLGPVTMNLSEAYFSQNQRLNHAAINPAFSFMYSMSHQKSFDTQYRFMEDEKASALLSGMTSTVSSDETPRMLRDVYYDSESSAGRRRPDIIMVILEGFSTHLMKSLGGEDIAVNLDSIASRGLVFTDFYANSFRTDRATPAIISGFPSQPSTSVMKYADKVENMPSIPGALEENGYNTAFYYGGDANFTNLMAYLVSCGFDRIISDKDFPTSDITGTWGANDMALFDRFLSDFLSEDTDCPRFRIVQTSSSHEPYDVPDYDVLEDIKANAFSYTDMCVGRFMKTLGESDAWDNTLVVFVADHWASYPSADSLSIPQRHSIPLVFSGGALAMKGMNRTLSSQVDIAATLLHQIGLPHDGFLFSKNILDPHSPHFAYFTEPAIFGMLTPENTFVYNCEAMQAIVDEGPDKGANEEKGKAFLQKLYDELEAL